MKECKNCKKLKEEEEFYKANNMCKICSAVRSKQWRTNNAERHRESQRRFREGARKHVRQLKDKPCTDCGKQYHFSVMEIDHLQEKTFTFASSDRSKKSYNSEFETCEVVCSNCHRIRTFERGQIKYKDCSALIDKLWEEFNSRRVEKI